MFTDEAYYYGNSPRFREVDTAPAGQVMFVISCGHHKLNHLEYFNTKTRNRADYHLLYAKQGNIYYLEDGVEKTAPEGSFLFFRPYEDREYRYLLSDKADIYWVHFSGSSAAAILKAQNLNDVRVVTVKTKKKYERLFNSMISALKAEDDFSTPLNALYIQELLLYIAKDSANFDKKTKAPSEYLKAVRYINEHIGEKISLNDIANDVCVSTKTLTRYFKKYQNMSPIRYVNFTKIEKAKILLHSDNSIGIVASALGFDDSLYFSTVFRRFVGISPEKYRKSILVNQKTAK